MFIGLLSLSCSRIVTFDVFILKLSHRDVHNSLRIVYYLNIPPTRCLKLRVVPITSKNCPMLNKHRPNFVCRLDISASLSLRIWSSRDARHRQRHLLLVAREQQLKKLLTNVEQTETGATPVYALLTTIIRFTRKYIRGTTSKGEAARYTIMAPYA